MEAGSLFMEPTQASSFRRDVQKCLIRNPGKSSISRPSPKSMSWKNTSYFWCFPPRCFCPIPWRSWIHPRVSHHWSGDQKRYKITQTSSKLVFVWVGIWCAQLRCPEYRPQSKFLNQTTKTHASGGLLSARCSKAARRL